MSRHTWDHDAGLRTTTDALVAWARDLSVRNAVDGFTISGGEPFEQPAALLELLTGLRELAVQAGYPVDILCYSGRPLSQLLRVWPDIVALCDVLVSEPFVRGLPVAPLRGSSNQRFECLTPLARSRYADVLAGNHPGGPRLQVTADPGGWLHFIGIPERDEAQRIEAMAAARGLRWSAPGWTDGM